MALSAIRWPKPMVIKEGSSLGMPNLKFAVIISLAHMSQRRGRGIPDIEPTPTLPRTNVVVFGETGVGKSSLINLIAGRSIAATSSGTKGCTFRHCKYELQVDETPYTIWDTAGLDEGTYGMVPAEIAEEHLKQLLRDLSRANGIHLLIYCIRATRLRQTLLRNYNLFYSAICRKKVPIVAVVTGLENYEPEMQDWWRANETEFAMLKMYFDGHACVTTLNTDKVNSPILKTRCHASRETVLSLIASTCARDRLRIGQDGWVSASLADARAMFHPSSTPPRPIVALYDLPEHELDPTGSTKDAPVPFEGAHLMDVGGTALTVHHIYDGHLRAGTRFKKHVSARGADLLVVSASVHSDPCASRQRAVAFYESYGGETRPLLVIVRGALSDERACAWWNASGEEGHQHEECSDGHRDILSDAGELRAIVRALPPPEHMEERRAAVTKLQRTIQTRSLQPVDVVPIGCFQWWTGRRRLIRRNTDAASAQDSLTTCDVWVPMQTRRL